MKKEYILFSHDGDYFYYTHQQAEQGKLIHGGYISKNKLFENQILIRGVCA